MAERVEPGAPAGERTDERYRLDRELNVATREIVRALGASDG